MHPHILSLNAGTTKFGTKWPWFARSHVQAQLCNPLQNVDQEGHNSKNWSNNLQLVLDALNNSWCIPSASLAQVRRNHGGTWSSQMHRAIMHHRHAHQEMMTLNSPANQKEVKLRILIWWKRQEMVKSIMHTSPQANSSWKSPHHPIMGKISSSFQ